jgi:hypothetical protein
MRGLLIVVLIVGLGYVFLRQKQNEKATAAAKPVTAQPVASSPALTPAPRGQASEHNYMKRAIDRASDVRDQARARTEEAQNP